MCNIIAQALQRLWPVPIGYVYRVSIVRGRITTCIDYAWEKN